jgi:DNA helicase-2/ATP-dependent DNA helicase PcrA
MPEIDREVALAAANCARGSVLAAAGCGKTEQIAHAASMDGRRRLILTHTNAGVDALRARLSKYKVPKEKYRIDTIAGWCLRYASAFPERSGLGIRKPDDADWDAVYQATAHLLKGHDADRVLDASYGGLFVDEYQDCTSDQHGVIVSLAERLPTCIFGDPLQAIFDFRGQVPVNWQTEVFASFPQVGELRTAHRWRRVGSHGIAEWLEAVRPNFEHDQPVQFTDLPSGITWETLPADSDQARASAVTKACWDAHGRAKRSSLIVIGDRARIGARTQLAQRLSKMGFSNIEPVGCAPLYEAADRIHAASGRAQLEALLDFASSCMTNLQAPALLRAVDAHFAGRRQGRTQFGKLIDHGAQVMTEGSDASIGELLAALPGTDGVRLYCRDRYSAMQRALKFKTGRAEATLRDGVWEVQNRLRHGGRRLSDRSVGSTLLVKGLEFDHAVIIHARSMTRRDWYVALTRGTKSLHVLSPEQFV